jgi:hypothetical protein
MNTPSLNIQARLRHLILIPHSGMCNRLRAVASARRLCKLLGAKCTLVWDWGCFEDFFEHLPDINIIPSSPVKVDKLIRHKPFHQDPSRAVDIGAESVEVRSNQIFWGSHEQKINLRHVLSYIPPLNQRLRARVKDFSTQKLQNSVGFHMRRTDQRKARECSPDALFFERAREVIGTGKKIFLATDNLETEQKMTGLFGQYVITYPKQQNLPQRWPRPFDKLSTEDDLVELYLLASTEYVVGSYWSSYSNLAIALNGTSKCTILKDMAEVEKSIKAAVPAAD